MSLVMNKMNNFKLLALGDIFLKTKDDSDPFSNIKDVFQNYDILFGNLETVLSNRGVQVPKRVPLQANPDKIIYLKNAGFDIVNLAKQNDYSALFDYCYHVLERVGYPYEKEVVVDNESTYSVKVTKCPHIDFVKEQPIACNVCKGMKLGILEAIYGEPVEIETLKDMAQGDEYCLSVFKKPATK